ncbi:hypothetical protein CFN79_15665 [Chromobacterium vaccinii]|nr:hypothetical protein CFN79_15665 [Chromobacterium vaccinii]
MAIKRLRRLRQWLAAGTGPNAGFRKLGMPGRWPGTAGGTGQGAAFLVPDESCYMLGGELRGDGGVGSLQTAFFLGMTFVFYGARMVRMEIEASSQ